MKFFDHTFDSPAENLACDEALLHMCEGGFADEVLRFWEPREHFVVLGYSNRIRSEVYLPYCEQHNIPVLRRLTGGGAVVQGPGCVNYALILKIPGSGPLQTISGTNTHIMTRHRTALAPFLGTAIEVQAYSDLAFGSLKFSGNAQRRTDRHILFHGTFLLDFDIPLVQKVLPLPSKQPQYRRNRSHREFLTNVQIRRDVLKQSIEHVWETTEELSEIPLEETRALARSRYTSPLWIFRF